MLHVHKMPMITRLCARRHLKEGAEVTLQVLAHVGLDTTQSPDTFAAGAGIRAHFSGSRWGTAS